MVVKIKRRYKLQKKVFEKRGELQENNFMKWDFILLYYNSFSFLQKKKKDNFYFKVVVGALYTKMEFVKHF